MPNHNNAPMCAHEAAASACGRCQPNGNAPSVPANIANAVTPTMLLRANNAFWPTKKTAETATQTSTSELSKSGSLSAGVTALPGIASNSFGKASAGATSANDNKGKGSNQNTNEFTGAITAVVTGVLPNGHLMISGEKQIGVNHNVDVLRFSGQVDPRMIGQGNAVQSTSVANVRIEQRGRGATSDAHAVGWLSRFFLNIAPS